MSSIRANRNTSTLMSMPGTWSWTLELWNLREKFSSNITSSYYKLAIANCKLVPNKKLPFFNRNNVNLLNSNAAVYDRVEETGCSADEKFAFILHGWRQDCDKTEWVTQLRESKYIFF